MKRALFLCAHPDDEIAVAGTIRLLVDAGVEVHVVLFATGNEGYDSMDKKDRIVAIRRDETKAVQKILGIASYDYYDYTDYGIPQDEVTYKICMEMVRRYRPEVVFTHYWTEYIAHKNLATVATEGFWQAGWESSLELGEPWKAKTLYHFENIHVLSKPTHIVDITKTYETKLEALMAYKSQHKVVPGFIKHIDALTRLRGNQIGVERGEAFIRSDFLPQAIGDVRQLSC